MTIINANIEPKLTYYYIAANDSPGVEIYFSKDATTASLLVGRVLRADTYCLCESERVGQSLCDALKLFPESKQHEFAVVCQKGRV